MLLNAAKCQVYSFYRFWVVKGKPTAGKITSPPRLGLKKELINNENTINNLSIILKNITTDTYNVFPLNKESSNEPILENNTDHTDSKNEIVYELQDVEVEHLQRRYQHFIMSRPISWNRPLEITNAARSLMLTKGKKLLNLTFKTRINGCVRYIFASLFFKSKRKHLWNLEKWFLLHFKISFCFEKIKISFEKIKFYNFRYSNFMTSSNA